ncbi:TonB-dependent receptor [Formosa haliotis]|uniref:TonB-dependent receptor n=1 Tax=Formosa haliotis TaxID=1555194 RepID=UPI000825D21D|nr:TonB-dependent receptor [Formosa haliotis]
MKQTLLLFLCSIVSVYAQENGAVLGHITSEGAPLAYVNVYLENTSIGTTTNEDGQFKIENIPYGTHTIVASFTGFKTKRQTINLNKPSISVLFDLNENESLDEIVVSGTLKPVSRKDSPVPVEVYSPAFLKKNPTPNIFDALQNVNGVRPQLNCNVCNTGDIHINGLEGPYTLVLIDGMPIVSGLSTVYGLSGIPNALIEQIEIIKGPASSLYGSEAVGGLINVITKSAENTSKFSADAFLTSWGELNVDLGYKANIGEKTAMLLGVNYYNYNNPIDNNNDNFTDVTLQNRVSLFQKWNFKRSSNKAFSLAGRAFYEDRWGGEMQWNPSYRGGNEVYGESIYTKRFELLGNYELPVSENIVLQFSYTNHDQNSVYGDVPYLAQQRIGFSQLTWYKTLNTHDLLFGAATKYTYYDDNTPATRQADEVVIPSLFIQDNITINNNNTLLLGSRLDYDSRHGIIFTPRVAYRFKSDSESIFRINAGTGFRVVNLFTEEHAALTGSRDVIIENELKPERSYNINLNYLKTFYTKQHQIITVDASAWYTYFTNVILPDYDTNPNQIIYDNLDGYAVTTGVSANIDMMFTNGLKVMLGATYQDVSKTEAGITQDQILTENFSGTWSISYTFYNPKIAIDYTGNIYGPMRLPLLGDLDPREPYSPVWSIQNIQATYAFSNFELYGGIKNLLNWTPNKGNPFIIARANDPFDKDVEFDNDGNVIATPDNPYALTFDPSYVYAPNQGRRIFLGLRYRLN